MSSTEKENGKEGRATKTVSNRVVVKERRNGRGVVEKREPELREQKIKRIKKQIDEGTYHVDAAEVAKAILCSETARFLGGKRR